MRKDKHYLKIAILFAGLIVLGSLSSGGLMGCLIALCLMCLVWHFDDSW